MTVERQKLQLGQTVKLSEPGRSRLPTVSPELCGVVVGFSRTANACRIQFPDRKAALTLHVSYLELAASPEADAAPQARAALNELV